jgi:hypothetical protein
MTKWVAVAYGALDVADDPPIPGAEVLVVPTVPAPLRSLFGHGAALWRRLAEDGPLDEADLEDSDIEILEEMADLGLASNDVHHEARFGDLRQPWLTSALHELVYALVTEVMRRADVEGIFIKGPVLHRQGLRTQPHSGDVDLWVAPGGQHRIAESLRAWGWDVIPFDFAEEMYHSMTLEPADWGCEIDVHYRFPGIGVEPLDAFRALISERQYMTFAGVSCPVPSVEANAVIYALHCLRPDPKVTVTELSHMESQRALRLGGTGALALAEKWKSLPVLGPEFAQAVPGIVLPDYPPEAPEDWKRRRASSVAQYHIAVIRSLPWRRRPIAVWRVLWPSGRTAKLSASRQGHPEDNALVAHLRRLALGLKQLFARH